MTDLGLAQGAALDAVHELTPCATCGTRLLGPCLACINQVERIIRAALPRIREGIAQQVEKSADETRSAYNGALPASVSGILAGHSRSTQIIRGGGKE